jgi:hypothetical protein
MTVARTACLLLSLAALGACDTLKSDLDSHEWHPEGINDANLAVMVQNPEDLVRGRSDPGPDRKLSAHAVTQLWANPASPFPTAGGAADGTAAPGGDSSGGGSGAGSGGGGSGGGGSGGGAGSAPGN